MKEKNETQNGLFELDMSEYIRLVFKNMVVFVAAAVVCVLAAFLFMKYGSGDSKQYSSSASFYVKDVNTNLLESYFSMLKSDYVGSEIAKKLEESLSEDVLKKCFATETRDGKLHINIPSLKSKLTFTAEATSRVINANAVTPEGEVSSAVCRALCDVAPDALSKVSEYGEIVQMNDGFGYKQIVAGTNKKIALAGLSGAVIFGIAFTVFFIRGIPVRSIEHIKAKTNMPILGEMPYYKG